MKPIEELALEPPYPEIPPGFWEQYGLWVGIAAVLVLAAGVLIGLWLLRKRPVAEIPIEVQTRAELESLVHQGPSGENLSRISGSLRRYLRLAFGLPPGEATPGELARQMENCPRIGPDLKPRLNAFFRQCDELKFSRESAPDPAAARAALELFEECERRRSQLRQAAASAPPAYP